MEAPTISEIEAAVARAVAAAYPPWLTVRECAAYLKITPHTVRKYVRRKKLAAYGKGGLMRLRRCDADRFMMERAR